MNISRGIKLLIVGSLLAALLVFAVTLTTAAVVKVDVCHVTNVPAGGDGHVISIADPAWPAHEAHGDKEIDPNDPSVTDNGDGTCHVAPTAVDDEVTTPLDTPVTIDVLANDIFVKPVDVSIVDFPLGGGEVGGITPDGKILYTPPSDPGTDSFTYSITDAVGTSDIATVTIEVIP